VEAETSALLLTSTDKYSKPVLHLSELRASLVRAAGGGLSSVLYLSESCLLYLSVLQEEVAAEKDKYSKLLEEKIADVDE
jgi:hypothetical protein